MICEEFEEISGAYALGAVTPTEREAADVHLASCPKCSHLLEQLEEVVDLLPFAAPQMNPPISAKSRLLAAIHEENSIALHPQDVTRRRHWRWGEWGTDLLAIALVFLLLLLAGTSIWTFSLSRQASALAQQVSTLRQQNSDLRAQNQALTQNIRVLQRQVVTAFLLQGKKGINGKLLYLTGDKLTVLTIQGLSPLRGNQVYQGWLMAGQKPTSIGLLSLQNGFASVIYEGSIDQFNTVAVSLEPGPAASKNTPAGPILASGQLKQANQVRITCSACG